MRESAAEPHRAEVLLKVYDIGRAWPLKRIVDLLYAVKFQLNQDLVKLKDFSSCIPFAGKTSSKSLKNHKFRKLSVSFKYPAAMRVLNLYWRNVTTVPEKWIEIYASSTLLWFRFHSNESFKQFKRSTYFYCRTIALDKKKFNLFCRKCLEPTTVSISEFFSLKYSTFLCQVRNIAEWFSLSSLSSLCLFSQLQRLVQAAASTDKTQFGRLSPGWTCTRSARL